MDSAAPHMDPPEEMARRAATRADVLLALAALPVQDVGAYLQAMAETITRALSVDTTGALIVDAAGDALIALGLDLGTSAAEHGSGTDRLPLSESSPLVDVYLSGTPYLAADVRDDPALPRAFASAGIRALLAVPLAVRGERRGILYVASHQPGSFTHEDQALLSVVAARVGLLVENAELAQRRAELEREQARQQARQEFVGIVSHELKTPVAVIKAYAEELQTTTALHRLAVHAAGRVVVHADRRRIEEVLVNLLENAIKYSPQGGDITVMVRRAPRPDGAGEQAVIAVSDRGIGIAPGDLPHVFERFYQAAGGRLHKGVRGLGVGLFIAREIVELHGGSMWVESAEGEGSTFYLTLPL